MRVLVFGACTFVGRHVIELLAANRSGDQLVTDLISTFNTAKVYEEIDLNETLLLQQQQQQQQQQQRRPSYNILAAQRANTNPNELYIRAVDSVYAEQAHMPASTVELYSQRVHFLCGNLRDPEFVRYCFSDNLGSPASAEPSMGWDLVIIATTVHRYVPYSAELEESVVGNVHRILQAAEEHRDSTGIVRCRQIVYLSTCFVYALDTGTDVAMTEPMANTSTAVDPSATAASLSKIRPVVSASATAEVYGAAERLFQQTNRTIPTIILRPSTPYGPGDFQLTNTLAAALECYRISDIAYKGLNDFNTYIDVVHVRDIARAILHSATWHASMLSSPAMRAQYIESLERLRLQNCTPIRTAQRVEIFNVTDQQNTPTAKLMESICEVFGVKCKRLPWLKRIWLNQKLVEEYAEKINTMAMPVWEQLLRDTRTPKSPITPFVDPLFLGQTHYLSVKIDGSRLFHGTGFLSLYPVNTRYQWIEVIDEWKAMGIWPQNDALRRTSLPGSTKSSSSASVSTAITPPNS